MNFSDYIALCKNTPEGNYQDYDDDCFSKLLLTNDSDYITYDFLYNLQDCLLVKQYMEGNIDCQLASRIISHINSVVGGGKDKHFLPLEHDNWRKAIELMKADFSHGDKRFEQILMPRQAKYLKYAEALKRLIKKGLAYRIEENCKIVFDGTEKLIFKQINDAVRHLGGKVLLNELFKDIPYEPLLKRFRIPVQGNMPLPNKREVEYPFNYILILGLTHLKHDGDKVDDVRKEMLNIMNMCRDICFVKYTVQAWDIWDDFFHIGLHGIEYLQNLMFKKSIYGLDQSSSEYVTQICHYIVDYHDQHPGLFTIQQDIDLHHFLDLMEWFLKNSDESIIKYIHKRKINSRINRREIETLLRYLCINESHINDGYIEPSDFMCVNYWPYPLVIDNKGMITLLPKPIMATGWMEALMAIIRNTNGNFDGEMGLIIEGYLKQKMTDRGINHVCGKYQKPVAGECDHVIISSDRLLFIEDKKKPLTRSAHSGNTDDIVVDLAKSLILAQEQCMGHAVDLIKNKGLDLVDETSGMNYQLDASIRKFEFISLSLSDYGPFQCRFLQNNIMDLFYKSKFGVDTSVYKDPEEAKKFQRAIKQVNHYLDDLRTHVADLASIKRKGPYRPFFNSWFISLEQMVFLIDHSNSSDELEANMKKLKFVSHGFYDIYTEWMLLN